MFVAAFSMCVQGGPNMVVYLHIQASGLKRGRDGGRKRETEKRQRMKREKERERY